MSQNLISLTLTDDQMLAVDNAIAELENQLKGLIALSGPQKRTSKKMGEKSESFCRQTLQVAGQNPHIVPANVPVADAIADLKTLDTLRPRVVRLLRLIERAGDTDAALGNDIMATSLKAYRLIKLTGRTEGLESQQRDLGARFAKRPRTPEVKAA